MSKREGIGLMALLMALLWGCGPSNLDSTLQSDEVYAGVCSSGESADYTKPGPYGSKKSGSLFLPEKLGEGGCKHPIIGFAPGIFMSIGSYSYIVRHLNSWGFAVAVDSNNLLNISASGAIRSVKRAKSGRHGAHLSDLVGLAGHSMGGAAIINASGNSMVKAIAAFQPGPIRLRSVNKPGLWIGGTSDMFGALTDPKSSYSRGKGPKFLAVLKGGGHVLNSSAKKNAYKASMVAWFRCRLVKDETACQLFQGSMGGECKLNGNWSKCEGKGL